MIIKRFYRAPSSTLRFKVLLVMVRASCMLLVILHHDAFCSNTNYGISLFRFTGTIESQDSSSREAENFDRNKDKSNYPGLDQQEQAERGVLET